MTEGKKVVTLKGEEVKETDQPDGALLDLAREFLDSVMKGEVKTAAIVTDTKAVGWVGDPLDVLGLMARGMHEVNMGYDALLEEEKEDEK